MKKMIALLMALAMLLGGLAALADAVPDPAGEPFVGRWGCGRATIEIGPEDAGYKVHVTWGNSASQTVEWFYACMVDPETGSLVDEGMGVKEEVTYAEGGDIDAVEELYADGAAVFTLDEDGNLIWDDLKENAAEEMVFERAIDFDDEGPKTVAPLPEEIDLEYGTYPASFDCENVADGAIGDVTLYTVDYYDIVDIATLTVGDEIIIEGEAVEVESLERDEDGWLLINGGIDEGGYDLVARDEDNVWRVVLDDDYATFTECGEGTFELDDGVTFIDGWDPESDPVTYTGADAVAEAIASTECEYFDEYNTSIRFAEGKIVEIIRIYTP